MKTKQTIAVIGATGNRGSAISKSLSKGNNRLLLCAGDNAALQTLTQQIGLEYAQADVEAMDCAVNACWEADIIILAVPLTMEKEVAAKIREVACRKTVISLANPADAVYNGPLTVPGVWGGEALQKQLPNSRVINVFHTSFAVVIKTVAALVSTDDQQCIPVLLT